MKELFDFLNENLPDNCQFTIRKIPRTKTFEIEVMSRVFMGDKAVNQMQVTLEFTGSVYIEQIFKQTIDGVIELLESRNLSITITKM